MKIGIIGAGAITRRGHLPALLRLPAIEAIALADVNQKTLNAVGKEFGLTELYTDYRDILADGSVSIIDICTPTTTHKRIVIEALHAGKHVLVEKPLALTLGEAIEIFRAVHETGRKLSVIQNYRYFPAVRKARERLKGGFLGRTVSMHGTALTRFPNNWTRSRWWYHPGGTLYDYAPHLIDLILWMSDAQLCRVMSMGGDFSKGHMGFINYAQIVLEFANGSVVTADASWLTGSLMLILEIHGTAGHIFLDVRNNVVHEVHGTLTPIDDLHRYLQQTKSVITGLMNGRFFSGANVFYNQLITDFINSVQAAEPPPIPVREGVLVNAVLAAAEESIQTRAPVIMHDFLQAHGVSVQEAEQILSPTEVFQASMVPL